MVLFFFEKNKTQTSPTCRNFGENKTQKHRIKYLNFGCCLQQVMVNMGYGQATSLYAIPLSYHLLYKGNIPINAYLQITKHLRFY